MHRSLGEILKEHGIIDETDLKKVLQLQKKSNVKLGQILIKKGLVSEEDLLLTLSQQYKMEYVEKLELSNMEILTSRVPARIVQKYRIVPFSLNGNEIRVALTDPLDLHPLDEIRLLWIGFDVIPVLAPESEIIKVIHKFYDPTAETTDSEAQVELEEGLEFLEDIENLDDSMDIANEAPIIKMVNVILSNAVSERASDIHIEPMEKEMIVRYRVDGILHKVLAPPKTIQNGIISRIKIMANLNIAENRLPQDGRFKIRFGGKDIDIRVSSLPAQFGERIVMRLLNKSEMNFSLSAIGFTDTILESFRQILRNTSGIMLITGPTGSGKTTTLYAALMELNDESKNIITVEDPVEYQIPGISQVAVRSKVGLTFAEGLRSILRQDPDIIMVGEIRDEETARIAIQSSLTGHLVFSTLHTNDSVSAVTRLMDMGIEPYLITGTVRGVMAQRLLRVLCPVCKKEKTIPASELKNLGYLGSLPKGKVKIYEPVGCKACMNTGYKGRTGVYELLVMNYDINTMILNHENSPHIVRKAIENGMTPLRMSALEKVMEGVTSLDEALRVTDANF